jgi:integrase
MTLENLQLDYPRGWTRNGLHYFRIKIPVDLRDHYNAIEIKKSLGTKDAKQAKKLINKLSVRYDDEFDSIRRSRQLQTVAQAYLSDDLHEVEKIDDKFIELITTSWLRESLEYDEVFRTDANGLGDFERQERNHGADEYRLALQTALATGQTGIIEETVLAYMRSQKYLATRDTPGFRKLAFNFLQKMVREHHLLGERDRGEPRETEAEAPLAKTLFKDRAGDIVTLNSLYEDWQSATARRPKTADDYRRVVAEFNQFVKFKNPQDLTKKDYLAYRDNLLSAAQHSKTVKKKLGILSTIFRLAIDNDRIQANPCERIRVESPKNEKKRRLSFTVEDLQTIFDSPVYRSGLRPIGGRGEAALWLPLIGAFTGAREEEIAQLLVSDIQHEKGMGWYFRISDEAEHSSVKNASSRRRVPIHPELIDCGLLEYVESVKDQNKEFLFPKLTPDSYGKRSASWSKWFGRYLRGTVNLSDRRKVFHSMRHTFKEVCRMSGINEEVHDALTGHSGGGEGRNYGSFPLAPLFGAMKAFCYSGLDLQHLKCRNAAVT